MPKRKTIWSGLALSTLALVLGVVVVASSGSSTEPSSPLGRLWANVKPCDQACQQQRKGSEKAEKRAAQVRARVQDCKPASPDEIAALSAKVRPPGRLASVQKLRSTAKPDIFRLAAEVTGPLNPGPANPLLRIAVWVVDTDPGDSRYREGGPGDPSSPIGNIYAENASYISDTGGSDTVYEYSDWPLRPGGLYDELDLNAIIYCVRRT